jgi:TonB family protein
MFGSMSREERFGVAVSGSLHLLLLILAFWMHQEPKTDLREAFIEVSLGEFRMGAVEAVSEEETPGEVSNDTQEQQARQQDSEPDPIELPTRQNIPGPTTLPVPEAGQPTPANEAPVRNQSQVRSGASDAGTSNDPVRSAPYQLAWEGDIQRAPLQQPMPNYVVEVEAVITVRFEVRADGTVGRIQPLQRMNPELEREVLSTLRSWRFSRLPSSVPQESQWGRITFRFVLK